MSSWMGQPNRESEGPCSARNIRGANVRTAHTFREGGLGGGECHFSEYSCWARQWVITVTTKGSTSKSRANRALPKCQVPDRQLWMRHTSCGAQITRKHAMKLCPEGEYATQLLMEKRKERISQSHLRVQFISKTQSAGNNGEDDGKNHL